MIMDNQIIACFFYEVAIRTLCEKHWTCDLLWSCGFYYPYWVQELASRRLYF